MLHGSAGGNDCGAEGGICAALMSATGGENTADSAERSASPAKGRVGAGLLLAFCCGHAAFLIASIVPRHAVPPERRNPALKLYRTFVGGEQQWNMFETIPTLHSFDARIEADDGQGGRTTVGTVLPGFAPYPKPERSRYYVLFNRMLLNSPQPSFFEAYLRKTDDLLRAQPGNSGARRWAMVVDVEWTRTLIHSSRDGVLYVPASRAFDPANPGGIPR